MKRLLAILLTAMLLLSTVACNLDNAVTQGGENNKGARMGNATMPEGIGKYIAQYPFLADLIYPEHTVLIEFDDSAYADDKVIHITLEPVDNTALDSYLEKLDAVNYPDYEFALCSNADGEPLTVIDYSSISNGWIWLEVYDYSGITGTVTISDAAVDGYDIPETALKYVGTLDKAYSDSDKVFYIKATDVNYGAFDALIAYYASNGGILDTESATSSEKMYSFPWGTVEATHFGLSGEMSIEITLD